MLKAIIPGVIVGLIGAAIWTAISHLIGWEIGWIAWGIGALVGISVAAALDTHELSAGTGVIAAIIALASVGAGKYAAAYFNAQEVIAASAAVKFSAHNDRELLISYFADMIVTEREEQGQALNYPAGADLEFPDSRGDYPADVWSDAEQQWDQMPVDEQREFAELASSAPAETSTWAATNYVFEHSFSLFDILWVALAGGTAFMLGSGQGQD